MPPKKSAPKKDPFEHAVFLIVGLMLLGVLAERLNAFLHDGGIIDWYRSGALATYFSVHVFPFLKKISFIVSTVSIAGIVYSVRRLTVINVAQNAFFNPPVLLPSETLSKSTENKRWERVLQHIDTENPNDWKFAILEADIILDELLDSIGYPGETMADKLKAVEPSDFETIEAAWEAHKIRNSIAHEGTDFMLTQREARRVIGLYRVIFEEFDVI